MSLHFGPIRQLGYVVRDIEAAMAHWSTDLGVGPWFFNERFAFNSFEYDAERHDDLNISVAMANSGDMQIELVQQRCQTPSMYRDFLETSGEGLQHVAFWPADYDAAYSKALKAGHVVGQEGELPRGRFVYFKTKGHAGTVFEFNEISPIRRQIIENIRAAAVDWDGSDPVRRA
jgi:hypothetical protein